ncbi:hypothetical protein COB72_05655 [bacterium]|nr:MAG: hypothetical protein COB72_05655 [bacterium]
MRVVALFRVSTERQATEGASLDAQERKYLELAAQSGWQTVRTFRGCESATMATRDRRVLQEVLACIRETEPDAIYVHEQSRLTRGDELEVATILRELRERQLKIIISGVVRDLASLDERFMIGIQSLVDRAESERIKERQLRGKREKALQGLKNSGICPYGYLNPPKGDPNRGRLQIVEEQAIAVRKIFNHACKGAGVLKIARLMNQEGIQGPRGGKWAKTTVSRLLKNPVYRGCHASGVWKAETGSRTFKFDFGHPDAIIIEDAHDAIVSRDIWDAAQEIHPQPRTSSPRLLSGLMSMNGFKATGDSSHKQSFYRAPRGARGGPWLITGEVDSAVWTAFVKAVSKSQFLGLILEEIQSKQVAINLADEHTRLASRLNKLESRLGRLLDMRADGEITAAEFRERSAEARNEIRTIKDRIREVGEATDFDARSMIGQLFAAAKLLVASETTLTLEQRRSVLERSVEHIAVKARRERQPQKKDDLGRYRKVQQRPWIIESVSFDMRIKPLHRARLRAHNLSCSVPPVPVKP